MRKLKTILLTLVAGTLSANAQDKTLSENKERGFVLEKSVYEQLELDKLIEGKVLLNENWVSVLHGFKIKQVSGTPFPDMIALYEEHNKVFGS